MKQRIAINGFGRIGRCVLRALFERNLHRVLQIVGINEPADLDTILYLTRYDSTHGAFPGSVSRDERHLIVNDIRIPVTGYPGLDQVCWRGIDTLLECSGSFVERAGAEKHIEAGAGRVLFSQPATAEVDATIIFGVNHGDLRPGHRVVSTASCSTNCVVPVIDVLHRTLGVEAGVITTIHSAMNDQPVLDSYHNSDLRKTRAAIQSMIPIDTLLAKGIDRVMPHLAGRFEAQAMRVPTLNVSAIDLSVTVASDIDMAGVNRLLAAAAGAELSGVLGYTQEPLASCDFNHNPLSGIVDASQTRVAGRRLAKVLIWFDNEWGYANRMLDLLLAWKLPGPSPSL